MSLVERALKKIQESRSTPPPPEPLILPRAVPLHSDALPEKNAAPVQRDIEPEVPTRIVHIDRKALRDEKILPPQQQERQLTDEYRHIKRPLLANAMGRGLAAALPNGRLIMVASALPGDGKTHTAINLTFAMALEKDISVLLVDADVAKPHVSGIFGVQHERGLLDVLRDDSCPVESVILPTDVPGLSILPAGRASDTATELLASSRMQRLVARLAARDPNRIVLFDSPPLLLTSESRVLATVVGQVVLVVRADVTPQSAVMDALDLLGEGKSVGLVLNQSEEVRHPGYSQYYGQRAEKSEEVA